MKYIILAPFMLLNVLGFLLNILTDMVIKPFIYVVTFAHSFMKELLK